MRFHMPTHWSPRSSYMVIIFVHFLIVLGNPSSYMTWLPILSEFPYTTCIWGKFCFLFYQCIASGCEDKRFREVGKLYFRKINFVTSAPFLLGKKNEKNVPVGIAFWTPYIKEITPLVHQENVQPKKKYKFLLGCTYLYCTSTVCFLPNTYRKLKTISFLHSVKFTYRYLSFWQRVAVVVVCSVYL